jgi:AAA family ATP:ADP antiporter
MISRIASTLWGDISKEELKRFAFLGATLFLIVGPYWILRLVKETILEGTVSYDMQPWAKMLSVIVLLVPMFAYQKLINIFKRHTLLYIIGGIYAMAFLCIAWFVADPTIGIANTVRSPWRLLGWITYWVIESFGSICPSLFWSFVVSITASESAKRGFPMVYAIAQLGPVLGCLLVANVQKVGGVVPLVVIAACCIALVPLMIKIFVTKFAPTTISMVEAHDEKKPTTGIFEGLRLIATKPYLLGILGVSTLYEIVGVIIEFQMKKTAIMTSSSLVGFTEFTGVYGVMVGILTFVFALTGTSFLLRTLGLATCLLLFPIVIGCTVTVSLLMPTLFFLTISAVLLKGLSYALNNPSKEVLYIPTSKDVKFKAKSWIEGMGSRSAKTTGAAVNATIRAATNSFQQLMAGGSLVALGIVGLWFSAAVFTGRSFNKLQQDNTIVE